MRLSSRISLFVCAPLLAACAPITSHDATSGAPVGVMYFLPQRDLIVEYEAATAAGECRPIIRIGTSEPYADRRHAFVADLPTSFIGYNESEVTVSSGGLLDSAQSHSRSALTEIILAAAESTVAFDMELEDGEVLVAGDACPDVRHKWRIPIPLHTNDLGNDLTVTVGTGGVRHFRYRSWHTHWDLVLEAPPEYGVTNPPARPAKGTGLYYRANIPYRVRIAAEGTTEDVAISLPNESPTLLAPAPRSVFGAKQANMIFEHGSLTGYSVDLEGDGLQLVSLPVRVLAALSGAASELFTFRRVGAQEEAAAIKAELALATAEATLAECRSALLTDDLELIRSTCGR